MFRKVTVVLFSLVIIASMVLSACAQPTPVTVTVKETVPVKETVVVEKPVEQVITATPAPVVEEPGQKILRLSGGSTDIPSIDPSHAVSMIEIQVIESTSLGLVRQNEETTEMENALATSYKVSDDGKTITFTLPKDVPWVKYDANKGEVVKVQDCEGKDRIVTADDFAFGILRTLDPRVASEYAYVLTPYLVGAEEYNTTPITDTAKLDENRAKVGVKVIDPQTIEYTFKEAGVYNLNLIGLWVAHAEPKWLIEGDDCTDARGERWTETGFFQGYGPFTLKEWVHDASLTMIKNPFWTGTKEVPQAKIDEVVYTFMEEGTALAEFEAGNLDTSGIPGGDMDRILSDPQYKDMIRQGVTLGTEFYAFQTKLSPTDDVRVRKALSLAIDRQAISDSVAKDGPVAQWYTNPGVAGAPKVGKFQPLTAFDKEKAKQLLDEYLKEKNLTADKLSVTVLFNTSDFNKRVAEAIQAMWKENLGIDVKLINQERKVFYAARVEGKENVYRSSWVQDYPDANNFLYEVFGPGTNYAKVVKWDGAAYDKFIDLLKQAAVEKDVTKRMNMYYDAEKIMVSDEAVVAPLWWYSAPYLAQTYVKFPTSLTGYDHFEKWDIVK